MVAAASGGTSAYAFAQVPAGDYQVRAGRATPESMERGGPPAPIGQHALTAAAGKPAPKLDF